MTTSIFSLNQTADRITGALAFLAAVVLAAPIILLAIAPFAG